MSAYGYCPECGQPGTRRERRPNGDDTCRNHHTYPSATALRERLTKMSETNETQGAEGLTRIETVTVVPSDNPKRRILFESDTEARWIYDADEADAALAKQAEEIERLRKESAGWEASYRERCQVFSDLTREEVASEKRIQELESELQDWRDGHKRVMAEDCPADEQHCGCVPGLRERIGELEGELADWRCGAAKVQAGVWPWPGPDSKREEPADPSVGRGELAAVMRASGDSVPADYWAMIKRLEQGLDARGSDGE